jgi:hypothetical protein
VAKKRKRQQSRHVYFRPGLEQTFHTLDLALATFPETNESDWLMAHSETEYKRFAFLVEAQARGEIKDLYFQPAFILLPPFEIPKNPFRKRVSKTRAATYSADASYWYNGIFVVEDTKALNKKTGKAVIQEGAPNRHKYLKKKLLEQYGANWHFKIVVDPHAALSEE